MARVITPQSRLALLAAFYRLDKNREVEIDWLPKLADTRGTAVDIGANYGLYTYELSRHFAHVHAFEPNPKVAETIQLAKLANVEVHVHAISSTPGRSILYIPQGNRAPMPGWASLDKSHLPEIARHEEIEVACKPLDAFGLTGVTFIKIDVEGHELEALRGSRETIAANRPSLLVEVMAKNRGEVGDFLHSLDYAERSLESIAGVAGSPQNLIFMPSGT